MVIIYRYQYNDYIILTPNSWDDYHYRTALTLRVIKDGEQYEGFEIKEIIYGKE